MVRLVRRARETLKLAGGLVAVALAMAVLVSCAGEPPATPTAPAVVPTPTSMPAIVSPKSGTPGGQPGRSSDGRRAAAGPRGKAPGEPPIEVLVTSPERRQPGREQRQDEAPEPGSGEDRLTPADGYIADGDALSPFATDHPAVANLAPELLAAVQRAAIDAGHDGVTLMISSGWRSERYQQSLLDTATTQYGSLAEARRWVNTPEQSTHVMGKAVDIGPTDAALWLHRHGNRYGLCQTYANELWHYELAIEPGGTCPRPLADASAG